jgi:hypothetical protein
MTGNKRLFVYIFNPDQKIRNDLAVENKFLKNLTLFSHVHEHQYFDNTKANPPAEY